ncbi:MAG TPA: DUF3488 and transglutaminase-like domain-containing protein [Telluria sp.]
MIAALRQATARLTRDKADALLLLFGALMVLAPHFGHLPPWISGVCLATLLWRALITVRGTRMPPVLLLLPIALGAMAGIYATFHTLLGRDAGVAMLVLLVAFKMLEMHARRDVFVVAFLCLFLVLANFFYSQSIPTALMMIASVIVLLTALMSFQFTGTQPPLLQRLRSAATMFALAAPAAIVLFLVFPRIQGPLWGMPGDASAGRTGLSDEMSPGNIASLAQSTEVAFRVRFANSAPAHRQMYWRAYVLGHFDGRTWTRERRRFSTDIPTVRVRGNPVGYEVTLEPGNGRRIFTIDLAPQAPRVSGNPVRISPEVELSATYPVYNRVRYNALSYPEYTLGAVGGLRDHARWLQLPPDGNRRARAWALTLSQLPAAERVNHVLRTFREQPFSYTLEPPVLGSDTVDEFLFATRAGFCEHYAGAFVFLMRASGLPARVVTGYQGGERNPVDEYYTVRQSDAHAWAEVWLDDRGWVRVDPTAAVSPERVQRGIAAALPQPAPFGIEGLGPLLDISNNDSLLAQLRFRFAAINNEWNQWVLNYTPARQRSFMDSLSTMFGNLRMLAAIAGALLLLYTARELRRQRLVDRGDALYLALTRQLARRGFPRQPHEGPSAYAARLRDSAGDKLGNIDAIVRFLSLYSEYKYGPGGRDAALVATMKRTLNESR